MVFHHFPSNLQRTKRGEMSAESTNTDVMSDSTFARWAYAYYVQFVRNKDMKNIIVKCVEPKDFSTSQNSTSNLTKHLEWCHGNVKLAKRKQADNRVPHPNNRETCC